MEEKKKWTVFFLMHAVKDFHVQAIETIRSILAIEKNDQIAVIFCLNINTENLPSDFETGEPRAPRVTTLFYTIARDDNANNKLILLEESTDFRIDNPQSIATFFKNKVLLPVRAERFMLITWDHGEPFALFPSEDLIRSSDPLPAHGNRLTIRELKEAIELAFTDQKIDVVVMFNCYLQFFDTGFELSSCVHYLAAFEMGMFFEDGLDYPSIFRELAVNPDIEPSALVKHFVKTFAISKDPGDPTKNQVVFSAHDLSLYPGMAMLIDELAASLINLLPLHKEEIRQALAKCRYLTNTSPDYCLVDFGNVVDNFHREIPEAFPNDLFTRLTNSLNRVILESYVGSDFKDERVAPFFSPTTFSIYFPDCLGAAITDFFTIYINPRSPDASAFSKRFQWVEFIIKFVRDK